MIIFSGGVSFKLHVMIKIVIEFDNKSESSEQDELKQIITGYVTFQSIVCDTNAWSTF